MEVVEMEQKMQQSHQKPCFFEIHGESSQVSLMWRMETLFWINFFIYILPLASFYYRLIVLVLNALLMMSYFEACACFDSSTNLLASCGRFSEFLRVRTDIDLRNRKFSLEFGLARAGRRAGKLARWRGQSAMVALTFWSEACWRQEWARLLAAGKELLTAEASVWRVEAVTYPHSLSFRLEYGTHSPSRLPTSSSSSFSIEICESVYSSERRESPFCCLRVNGDPMAFSVSQKWNSDEEGYLLSAGSIIEIINGTLGGEERRRRGRGQKGKCSGRVRGIGKIDDGMDGDQGVKVPMERRGSLPVSRPRAVLTLLATNWVFLVRSAQPLMPSPQACLMIMKQLQQPSMQPTQESAQLKRQYLRPLEQFSSALELSPSLHSMHSGAQQDQQQASQQRQARPHASHECQQSMHIATLYAAPEKQQHWQHFFRNSITAPYSIIIKDLMHPQPATTLPRPTLPHSPPRPPRPTLLLFNTPLSHAVLEPHSKFRFLLTYLLISNFNH